MLKCEPSAKPCFPVVLVQTDIVQLVKRLYLSSY